MSFKNGGEIVVEGLILAIDPGARKSYTSGTTILDISGNSANMTLNGVTVQSGSVSGSVLTFVSASNQNMGFTSSADFNFGTGEFCFEQWFKTSNSTTRQHTIGFGSGKTNFNIDMNDSGYGIWAFYSGSGTPYVRTTTNYGDGNWHHIIVQRSGTTVTLYVDGVSKGTDSFSSNLDISSQACKLGSTNGGSYPYNGELGPTFIYNRSLTSAERTQNYNALKGRFL